MTQTEWAARVAEIGKLARWQSWFVVPLLEAHQRGEALTALAMMDGPKIPASSPAVIAAIRQLLADWLSGEGVVANRVCRWSLDADLGCWRGACGVGWFFDDGDLAENDAHYCPRCGGKIEVTA
jgi:hypothetical protein